MSKFKVGDLVKVEKPSKGTWTGPGWCDEMDDMDLLHVRVDSVGHDYDGPCFKSGEWFFHDKWATLADSDPINSPPHYQSASGIECIDAIRAALTDEEFRGYCKGNAIKYVWRERMKGGDESLGKAEWYLNRAAQHGGE